MTGQTPPERVSFLPPAHAGSIPAMDARMLAAVENNARWCDLVCRSHAIPTRWSDELWIALERPPRLYPDVVSLAPGIAEEVVLEAVAARSGCFVKDSFADLDLGSSGFVELFEASWFHRPPPASAQARPRLRWTLVTSEDELGDWASRAELEDIIRPELLQDAAVRFLAAADERGGSAGAIVNRTGDTLGVSNVFSDGIDEAIVWAELPAAIAALVEELPLVGYEHGEPLTAATASGFESTAPLRVWLRPPNSSGSGDDAELVPPGSSAR